MGKNYEIESIGKKGKKIELGFNIFYKQNHLKELGLVMPSYEIWAILDDIRKDKFCEKLREILYDAPLNEDEKRKIFEQEGTLFLRLINIIKKY
ncbi:MAG: hypothetical protein QW199_03220, partial [Candidatus Pacearchaeota archaeon]